MKLHSPLDWPVDWRREGCRERAKFDPYLTFSQARNQLNRELELFGATKEILSVGLALTASGFPAAKQPRNVDQGVALYYTRNGTDYVIPLDRFDRVEHNIRALAKTIEGWRGQERWGTGQILERQFRGFAALPERTTSGRAWWDVLGVTPAATKADVEAAFKRLARLRHPDAGGTVDQFVELQEAYQRALGVMSPV